jgi:hypothetical protein
MIGAFPRHGGWVSLHLAAASGDHGPLVLLELAGDCPGDPDAEPTRVTTCADPRDAFACAIARQQAGWAAYACDRPARRAAADAARHAPARTPCPDRREQPLPGDVARAVAAHAAAVRGERFCLFPNPAATLTSGPRRSHPDA